MGAGVDYATWMQRFIALILSLLLAGCARTSPSSRRSAPEADAEFERIAAEYTAGYLAWRPQVGTALGLHEYDGRISDYSQASLAAELARLKSFDARLGNLHTNELSRRTRCDYLLLRCNIQREIFGFEPMHIYSHNPMTYAGALDVNIYIKRDFAPLVDRVRSINSILRQAPALTASARQNLVEALPRPEVETAMEQAEGMADFLSKDLVMALRDVKDERLMAEFKAANATAIAEMRGYASYLKEHKLPKANDAYALGRENYRKLLECGELVTLPPEQLLELGMQDLRRQQAAFAAAAKAIDPSKSPSEVFRAIQKDHPTDQQLIADTRRDLDVLRQFVVDRRLVIIPSQVAPRVTETPQFLRATSFASMDTPGPFEKKATEAYYYITPVEPEWSPAQKEEWLTAFNYYTTDIVSIHEAYPGHYVQFLCLNASPANRLEKTFSSYAFVEGWAHYSEQMMVDEGFGASTEAAPPSARWDAHRAAKYRLAQADEALLRVCRMCVSIRMHCQGMTVTEAAKFFQDNCYYEPKPARQEAVRGTFDPEYLYYTLGKLEIMKLREDYRRQEGAGFSLEKFHNELLSHGAPPIRVLRELMLKDARSWDKVL